MKNIIAVLLLTITLASCSTREYHTLVVEGTISGAILEVDILPYQTKFVSKGDLVKVDSHKFLQLYCESSTLNGDPFVVVSTSY